MQTKTSTNQGESKTADLVSKTSASNFWKLWSANASSNLGDGLYQTILPLLAVQLTRSPALVAGVGVMLSLPWLIFALPAGSIADRFDRRQVMLSVNAGRLLVLLCLTLAVMTNSASLPVLYAAALFLGIGETLMDTSLTSIVPALVSKERLSWANARITAAQIATNTFVGPPLAGYLVGIGFAVATGFSTLMYSVAGFALILMRGIFGAGREGPKQTGESLGRHLTEGLRFLWNDRILRNLTLFTASMNLFWAGWGTLLVLYAVTPGPMELNEFGYGLLLTAMAIGGFLGSMLCERIQKRIGTRNALTLDFLGTILLVGTPALTTNAWAVGMAALLAGFGASIWVVLVSTIRQRVVPNALLGRVYSASRFISWGVGPLGAILAALVAEVWGIRTMFAAGGIAGICLTLVFLTSFPSKTLDILSDPISQR
jgi:MFS family permease